MKNKISRWELGGVVVVFISGSLLHFAYEWSGGWPPIALVAAVNESIWEHLKLAFWPAVIWGSAGVLICKADVKAYWSIKGWTLLIPPFVIVGLFAAYTSVLGHNELFLDISIFLIAVAAGQATTAYLLSGEHKRSGGRRIGLLLLAAQLFAYSSLTYFPPHLPLFEDSRTGEWGLPSPRH